MDQTKSKVPELSVLFWFMKIIATTLGEIGGDAVSMSMDLGYLLSTSIFAVIFLIAVTVQVRRKNFNPAIYWATLIATTTVGTTLADFADRSLGIGYLGGSLLLLSLLLISLWIWHRSTGSVAINTVDQPKTEFFYWLTILFSQTLGTALGDALADSAAVGYLTSAIVFGSMLVLISILYFSTQISRTLLFWAAFILTRPLGAVVGDFLDKPTDQGGLALSRYTASAALIAVILACLVGFKQRAADRDFSNSARNS
jgi:uncharacterized membrane-anchored protein